MYNIAIPSSGCPLPSSTSKMTSHSGCHCDFPPSSISEVTVSCSVGAHADNVGLSSTTFAYSITLATTLSIVMSSLVTFLATYFLCFKRSHRKSQIQISQHGKQDSSQQVVKYEEVGIKVHLREIATEPVDTTYNVAYDKI